MRQKKRNIYFGKTGFERYNLARTQMLTAFGQRPHSLSSLSVAIGLKQSSLYGLIKGKEIHGGSESIILKAFEDLVIEGIIEKVDRGNKNIQYYRLTEKAQEPMKMSVRPIKKIRSDVLDQAEELFRELQEKLVRAAKLEVQEEIDALRKELKEAKDRLTEEKEKPTIRRFFNFSKSEN